MTRFGYFLSSEEYEPASLIKQAKMAEQAGFEALWISDMTYPTTRIYPAIIAQAAATAGLLTDGRFFLGVGSGEALNEHITGTRWPAAAERLDMLEEAVSVIARLLTGAQVTHRGRHYQVETARLYSVPSAPPPIFVSGFGEKSARLAARIADGYICMGPKADLIKLYRDAGGGDQPVQGGIKGCWAPDTGQARETMRRLWATDFIPGEAAQLLPSPRHYAQLSQLVTQDMNGAFEFYATQVLPRARER